MHPVTSKQLLQQAQAEGYAIGKSKAGNIECIKAVIGGAKELVRT